MFKILKELTEIRKELQNIRVILQSKFVNDIEIEYGEIDGKRIRRYRTLEDPLGKLRKDHNIDQ